MHLRDTQITPEPHTESVHVAPIRYLSRADLAALLGLHVETISRKVASGHLP